MSVSRVSRLRWPALLAVAGVGVAWRGGYTAGARGVTVLLAGVAVLVAISAAPDACVRATREPIVRVLAFLALLTALSATWTIGDPSTALRDGALVLALVGVLIAAATLPARWGHGAVLLAAALACAVSGLVATLASTEPRALLICGAWRPAGPFEYPPALALTCAGALPVALAAAGGRRRWLATLGALSAWLLATTIALTGNRTGIALGALALAASVALAPSHRRIGPQALLVLAGAGASALLLRGDLAGAQTGRQLLALVVGASIVTSPVWIGARRSAGGDRGRWTAIVAFAALLAGGAGVLSEPGGCGGELSHGRVGIWRAALDTATERPIQGFGAGTFLIASRRHQLSERPVPTRYAHDLALESWVELGLAGLLATLAWYSAVLSGVLKRRSLEGAWMLIPAVAAFPLATLLDWPWQLAGVGVLWAIAAGGVLGLS
jgi:hypothetical protein